MLDVWIFMLDKEGKEDKVPQIYSWLPWISMDFFDLWQDESYDLQDRKAFAKFLIDADIRLVSWKSHSTGLFSVSSVFCLVVSRGWDKLQGTSMIN